MFQALGSPHLGPQANEMTQSERSFAANERFAQDQEKNQERNGYLNSTFDRQTLQLQDQSLNHNGATDQSHDLVRLSMEITDLNAEKKQLLKDEISECMRLLDAEDGTQKNQISKL